MASSSTPMDMNTIASVVAGVVTSLQSQSSSAGPRVQATAASSSQTTSIPLPSILGRRRRSRSTVASSRTKALKVVTWDRTIVCLPSCYPQYCKSVGGIAIPRKKRSVLAANGLIGKIHLESDWSEDEVFAEIRSVFSDPMDGDASFPFKILLLTGSGTKSLTIPSLSSSYKWTPKEVAGRADSFIYILAEKDLKNENGVKAQLVGEEDTAAVLSGDDQGGERGDGAIHERSGSNAMNMPQSTPGRTTTSRSERNRDMSGPTVGSSTSHSGSNAAPSTSTYDAYVNLLSDSDSEDDVIVQRAIAASLDERRDERSGAMESANVSSVLKENFSLFPISMDPEEANRLVIRRKHIWNDAIRALSKYSFDYRKSVQITFVGEEAVDEGGPKREFFHLALKAMADDHTIFQGPSHGRSFVHNVQALAGRKFFFAGMLVAISLGNGGPGFPCLAESVFNYLCYGLGAGVQPNVDDIPDYEIKEKLEKIKTTSTNAELQSILLEEEFGFIRECGFIKPATQVTQADLPTILKSVCREYMIVRSSHEMAQFLEGLDTLHIASLMKVHSSAMQQLFTHTSAQVTSRKLAELLVPIFSPRGSNVREDEEAVILNWNDYLQDMEDSRGDITPACVLAFVTGAPNIPPMGFNSSLAIRFIEDKSKTLPTASTCSLVLWLPLALVEYDQFKEKMDFALQNTIGFGQV